MGGKILPKSQRGQFQIFCPEKTFFRQDKLKQRYLRRFLPPSLALLLMVVSLLLPQLAKAERRMGRDLALVSVDGIEPALTHRFKNKIENSIDGNWGEERSCVFDAWSGRIFNRSIVEKLMEVKPTLTVGQGSVKVHIHESLYNDWAHYDKAESRLVGVPLRKNIGMPFQFVISVEQKKNLKIPCKIKVFQNSFSQTGSLHWKPDKLDTRCRASGRMLVLILRFDANPDILNSQNRIQILKYLSNFLKEFIFISRESLVLEITERDNEILFGTENIHSESNRKSRSMSVLCPIKCGLETINFSFSNFSDKFTRDRSLPPLTGYDVVEWKVESQKLGWPSNVFSLRSERDFHNEESKSTLPKIIKKVPFTEYFNKKARFDAKEKDYRPFRLISNRFKTQNHIINKRSVIKAPGAIPNKRHLHRSKPPYIPSLKSSSLSNNSPLVDHGIDNVTVYKSTYFEKEIKKNAFADKGGDSRSLLLTLLDDQNSNDFWLILDQRKQLLYGVSPVAEQSSKGTEESAKESYSYVMKAQNREGNAITHKFTVQLEPKPQPRNHRFIFYISKYMYSLQEERNKIVGRFARLLTRALDLSWRSVEPPGQLTFHKVDFSRSKLSVTWFENSLGSKSRCERDELGYLIEKMTGLLFDEVTDERVPPSKMLKKVFQPHFIIKSVKIILSGPCLAAEKIQIDEATEFWSFPKKTATTAATSTSRNVTLPSTSAKTFTTNRQKQRVSSTTATITATSTSFLAETFSTLKYFSSNTTTITPKNSLPRNTTNITPENSLPTNTPTTFSYLLPKLLKRDFTISINAVYSKISLSLLNKTSFRGVFSSPSPLTSFQWVAKNKISQNWISFDPKTWVFIALPMFRVASRFKAFNSSRKVWMGTIFAVNEHGWSSEGIPTSLNVSDWTLKTGPRPKPNHIFGITISNYDIKNFTALQSYQVMKVINEMTKMSHLRNISVYSIESGSVVFSWFYDQLAAEPNPCSSINQLKDKLLTEDRTPHPQLVQRFQQEEFIVTSLRISLTRECEDKAIAAVPSHRSTVLVAIATNASEDVSDNGGKDGKVLQLSGNLTGTLIGATIAICVVVLLLIIFIKFKSRKRALEKKKQIVGTKNLLSTTPREKINQAEDLSKRTLKPNFPVVFDGEEVAFVDNASEARELNSHLHNNRESETLSFSADERPPPPPYKSSNL